MFCTNRIAILFNGKACSFYDLLSKDMQACRSGYKNVKACIFVKILVSFHLLDDIFSNPIFSVEC